VDATALNGKDTNMNKTSFLLAATMAFSTASACAQSADKGRVAFIKNGCWQCHGFEGQGGSAGLKLAPDPKPLEYIAAFIRNTNGPMPPYPEKMLPKEDVADIHAYLKSLPKAPDYKSIPLLN
jgi:ubiquinol-cytochrome c reductase cytochrome c subunit